MKVANVLRFLKAVATLAALCRAGGTEHKTLTGIVIKSAGGTYDVWLGATLRR